MVYFEKKEEIIMSIQKFTFGTPEAIVPSRYCKNFNYNEGKVDFDAAQIYGKSIAGGYLLEFPIGADEQVYGFGLQLKQFNHKGKKLTLRVNADPVAPSGDSHAPVPFFVTTACRGFYFDTARYAEFYCGYPKIKANATAESAKLGRNTDELYAAREIVDTTTVSVKIPGATGIDLYVIEGEDITDVVAQYNMLSGGGCDMPEWGLGTIYRCYTGYSEDGILDSASEFIKDGFPVQTIGLEPGWHSAAYSCSFVPSTERYPHFDETIQKLIDMGYHINLWEHCFTHPTAPFYDKMVPYAGNYPVWGGLVPDFTIKEARDLFAKHHRERLIDLGIDGFKLDECDGSDYTGCWTYPSTSEFPGGADGEQMHSLIGSLYAQTLMEALDGKPTMCSIRSMGALAASYPFVLYSDLYDHEDFIRGVVNQGFSGILWSPEVRQVESEKELIRRMQVVVFSVQSLINAWCCETKYPWTPYDCTDTIRELLELRVKLIPMLKAAFDKYRDTGIPPIRALVMDYTTDTETYGIDDEYLFCEDLLVAPLTEKSDTRKVYLPAGNWRDFFTKEPVASGWFEVTTENIPVYERY